MKPSLALLLPVEGALNPVMVKELRQVVRSRFMVSILLFFLAVLLFAVGGFVIAHSIGSAFGNGMRPDSGRQLFQILLPILNVACFLFVPAYVGVRLAAEHSDTNIDLLFTTAIRPGEIIRGKLYSGIVVTGLLYSATTPFLAFTYLLRGIDLPTIFLTLAFSLLLNVLAVQAGIFFGAIPASRVFKSLLGLGALVWMAAAVPISAALMSAGLRSGLGGMLTTAAFWATAATVVAGWFGAVCVLHVLAVAMIMPPASNRALPIRMTLTALWGAGAVVAALWAALGGAAEALLAWYGVSAAACAAMALVAVSERDRQGPRILRTIPPGRRGRMLAFLFYSGAGGGILWALLTAAITVAGGLAMTWATGDYGGQVLSFLLMFLYVYAYALTAAWARNTFLARRLPRRGTWVLALLLIAAGSLAPSVAVFLQRGSRAMLQECQYGNVFASFDPLYHPPHFWCAGLWAAVATWLNARWVASQYRAFRRAGPAPAEAPRGPPP